VRGVAQLATLAIGLVKLGQPQPESNFADEANNGSPETMST
jgi:hypothetical protein